MNTIAERVASIVAEQSGVSVTSVKPESLLVGDLGMDSLDITETVMAIEDEFAISIDDERAERMSTVADIIAHVKQEGGE